MLDDNSNHATINKLFNSKNVINNESLLLNELLQNTSSHLFNIQKYKLYVEQTEQVRLLLPAIVDQPL